MTNTKYLKENNLYEAHKHFMRMVEGFGYGMIEDAEEDPDDAQMQQPQGGEMGGMQNVADMGDGTQMGGNEQGDMNNPMDGADDGAGMDAQGGMPEQGDMGDPMGGMDDSMGDMDMDMDASDDEEVIDVEDITNAEEKVNDKVNSVGRDVVKVNHRIEKLLGAIEDMQAMIANNNNNIEALEREFQKRNPTQTEKLRLRSLDSYPFNVNPVDYWDKKSAESNYEADFDNRTPTTKEYVITNDDVDDLTEREAANSFYVDDEMKQDIKKIFGL